MNGRDNILYMPVPKAIDINKCIAKFTRKSSVLTSLSFCKTDFGISGTVFLVDLSLPIIVIDWCYESLRSEVKPRIFCWRSKKLWRNKKTQESHRSDVCTVLVTLDLKKNLPHTKVLYFTLSLDYIRSNN